MWNAHRNSLPSGSREKEKGSVSIPLLFLIVVLGGAAFSSLTYAFLWRSKVLLQLRLDVCVEEVAMELQKIQNQIEAANFRMKTERAAAAAAAIPTAGASLKAANAVLIAESLIQEGLRMKWRLREGLWLARRGCDGKGDFLLPLPQLRWWRPPEDSIGPQPLEWEGKKNALEIRLWKTNRFSQASVSPDSSAGMGSLTGSKWKARWIPRTRSWTNPD